MQAPIESIGADHPIATSIGIAICPDDARDRQTLLIARRHRALSRQERRPRAPIASSRQHGRRGARTPPARARPAQRDLPRRVAARLSAAEDASTPAGSSASRPCCAGSTRRAARFRRRNSSRSPKRPAAFFRSASGCCGRPAARRRDGAQPLTIAVNVSAVQIHNRRLRPRGARDPVRDRAFARAAGAGDHRDRAGPRFEPRAGDAPPDQDAGRPHRHGRFRHRLFVALEPARLPVRQDQDRRLVHQIGQCQRPGRHDRARGAGARPGAQARRCWRKASRPTPNSSSSGASIATRCRAFCSAVRPISRFTGG